MSDVSDNSGKPPDHEKHEQQIRDLAHMRTDSPATFENLLDNADAAYVLAHDAGLMRDADGKEEPFVYPSVRREQLYNELVRETPRPPLIAGASAYEHGFGGFEEEQIDQARLLGDPRESLKGQSYPFAILEEINDNDSMGQGSYTVMWLGCESLEQATSYCEVVGWEHEKPGPGEGDGVYTTRKIYDNPYHLDQLNASLGEIDRTAIGLAIAEVMSAVGVEPSKAATEYAVIEGMVIDIEDWNRIVSTKMLSSEDRHTVRAYLNHKLRGDRFNWARTSIRGVIQETTNQIADTMGDHKPQPFSSEERDAIETATTGICEALQTRYELKDGTREAVTWVLENFLYIARMQATAEEVYKVHGSQEERDKWFEWADGQLLDTVQKVSETCSAQLRHFTDSWHILA